MKKTKIIIAVLSLFLLLSSLSVVSFAANDTLRIAEDYSYIEYGDDKYVRVNQNIDNVEFSYDEYLDFTSDYTEKQETEILEIDLYGREYYAIRLSVYFVNGGSLTAHYVREDHLAEYNDVASLTSQIYSFYKDGKRARASRDQLFYESSVMSASLLMTYEKYYVDSTTDPRFCYKESGLVIISSDESCYYLDYAENGTSYEDFSFLNHDTLTVHKISDTELCEILRGDEEPTEKNGAFIYATMVIMGVFLGILPLAIGILCFMKRKGAKNPYRRLYTILMAVCAVTVVLLVILAIIVLPYI